MNRPPNIPTAVLRLAWDEADALVRLENLKGELAIVEVLKTHCAEEYGEAAMVEGRNYLSSLIEAIGEERTRAFIVGLTEKTKEGDRP